MAKIKVAAYNEYAGYFEPTVDIVNEDGLYEQVPYDSELHEIQHILDNTFYPGDPGYVPIPEAIPTPWPGSSDASPPE